MENNPRAKIIQSDYQKNSILKDLTQELLKMSGRNIRAKDIALKEIHMLSKYDSVNTQDMQQARYKIMNIIMDSTAAFQGDAQVQKDYTYTSGQESSRSPQRSALLHMRPQTQGVNVRQIL